MAHHKKKHGHSSRSRVPPSVGGMGGPKERKRAEITYLRAKGKHLSHKQKKFEKHEEKSERQHGQAYRPESDQD